MNILVFGQNGQVAKSLLRLSLSEEHQFRFCSSVEVNFLNSKRVSDFLLEKKFDLIINAAAYTLVDQAEIEKEKVDQINVNAVGIIADWCARKDVRLIHFSTDYVYGDSGVGFLSESVLPKPINYYGYSKLESEKIIKKSGCRNLILRTSWIYSPWGNNFLKTMLRLGKEREEIRVVSDQFGSPTSALELGRAVIYLLKEWTDPHQDGIYNFSSSTVCSWWDFAQMIFETSKKFNRSFKIKNIFPISTEEYFSTALRQKNSRLCKNKIQDVFDLKINENHEPLEESLKILFEESLNG